MIIHLLLWKMTRIVKEKFLNYKDTYIFQDKDSFCYNLDSVLLANFMNVSKNKKIIDLATGNIPIPLILVKKYGIKVDCIEIQKNIFSLGKETIEANSLEKYINLFNYNIMDVNKYFNINSYDIVSINPPYFKNNKENTEQSKTIARHEKMIDLDNILKKVNYLLNNKGHFYMIHRTERLIEIINKLRMNNLIPKRIMFVHPYINSPSKLFLIDCIKNGKDNLIIEKPIIIYKNQNIYTEEILEMLGDVNDSK